MILELEDVLLMVDNHTPAKQRAQEVLRLLLRMMRDAAGRRCAKCRTRSKMPGLVDGFWRHTPSQTCGAQYERTQIELIEIWLRRLA